MPRNSLQELLRIVSGHFHSFLMLSRLWGARNDSIANLKCLSINYLDLDYVRFEFRGRSNRSVLFGKAEGDQLAFEVLGFLLGSICSLKSMFKLELGLDVG